jgi:branched-chain amino acid transport system permease protein
MLLQFVINGIITGILYSLSAIGFALVYNTTRIFHIAAAALYVAGAYIFILLSIRWNFPCGQQEF